MNDMADIVTIDLLERGEVEKVVTADVEAFPDLSATLTSNISKPSVNIDPEEDPSITWLRRLKIRIRCGSEIKRIGSRESEVRAIESCPAGYPRLAALLDSDENFMLYRRFGYLQARILLNKQDELRKLERDLDDLDEVDAVHSPSYLKSRELNEAKDDIRKRLLEKIAEKFKEYADLLTIAQTLAGFNKASKRDYRSMKNYFERNAPISIVESYIYCKQDLITLKPGREDTWLDAMVEKCLRNIPIRRVRALFCNKDLSRKADSKSTGIVLFSRTRVNLIVAVIILLTILALLIIPVYILFELSIRADSGAISGTIIGVLLVFTMAFSLVLGAFTRPKRHEILAAAAAYCAVLVVFIGNVGQFSHTSASQSK